MSTASLCSAHIDRFLMIQVFCPGPARPICPVQHRGAGLVLRCLLYGKFALQLMPSPLPRPACRSATDSRRLSLSALQPSRHRRPRSCAGRGLVQYYATGKAMCCLSARCQTSPSRHLVPADQAQWSSWFAGRHFDGEIRPVQGRQAARIGDTGPPPTVGAPRLFELCRAQEPGATPAEIDSDEALCLCLTSMLSERRIGIR